MNLSKRQDRLKAQLLRALAAGVSCLLALAPVQAAPPDAILNAAGPAPYVSERQANNILRLINERARLRSASILDRPLADPQSAPAQDRTAIDSQSAPAQDPGDSPGSISQQPTGAIPGGAEVPAGDATAQHSMGTMLSPAIDAAASGNPGQVARCAGEQASAIASQAVLSVDEQSTESRMGSFAVEGVQSSLLQGAVDAPQSVAMSMITAGPISAPGASVQVGDGPIVIDNDEEAELFVTIEYEDLPTDEEKSHVKAGARFPVVMVSEINSKTAKKGDPIEGRLKYDLKIGDRLIAQKGSRVRGHLTYALKARTVLGSMVTTQRFYRNSGVLGIAFDEIINEKGEHLPLVAKPAKMDRIIKNKAEGRELGVNHLGQITGPWSQQLRYKAIRVGLNFALAPAGVFSFGAMPVALGVMGAVNPSFAFMKPVGLNVRHRRLKGFAWGFLSGIPGSWLIEDTTCRGQEAVIKPGDEFLAEFREQFTGEPATDAQLLPGAGTKVRGELVKDEGHSKPHAGAKKR